MWTLKMRRDECSRVQESLGDSGIGESLPTHVREHASKCADCAAALKDMGTSRELLRAIPRQPSPGPWFAPRVMAAIAAGESDLRRSMDAWTVVPKLARKLSWVSALALLLAGSWLLGQPASTPSFKPAATDITGEPVLESSPPLNNDELLLSLAEMGS
jgi:hypothetical protein